MGLDMYLSKKHYVQNWEHNGPERKVTMTVKLGGKKHPLINTTKVTYITEEVGYWRKANQIHDWFVKNVQDGRDECQESSVSREKLQELYDACILVRDNSKLKDGMINNGYTFEKNAAGEMVEKPIKQKGKFIEDPTVAQELLPSASGFFFGGTDYDQYYLQDILDTIKILEPELKIEYPKGVYEPEYIYRASW
jgi:hypothetical protein